MINPGTIIFVCRHVLERERRVELLVHHSDGGWQATCGAYDHPAAEADIHPVHLHHPAEADAELADVAADTPRGCLSERVAGRWEHVARDD